MRRSQLSDFRPLKNSFRKCSFLVFHPNRATVLAKNPWNTHALPFPSAMLRSDCNVSWLQKHCKREEEKERERNFPKFFKVFVCQSGSRFLSETVAIRRKQYCAIDQNKDFMLEEPHWSLYPDAGSLFFTFREILPSYWNSISRTIRSSTS